MFKKCCFGLTVFIITSLFSISMFSGFAFARGEGNKISQQKDSNIVIVQKDNLMSAEINNAPIEDVFQKIYEEFNIEYKIYPEMKNKIITVSLKNAPIQEGIQKIVEDNYLFNINNEGKITKVYILSKGNKDFKQRNSNLISFVNEEFLSFNKLKATVTNNVRKERPLAQLFTIIPHEDIKGNLRSYIFSYYIGSNDMPSREKVENNINEAWKLKKEARKHISAAYKNRDSSTMIEWMEKSKPHDYNLRQTQDFITLEIAANYSAPPVKKFYKGLPYDLAMYPNAVELLERKIENIEKIEFKRTFIIDLLAIGFEFVDAESNKSYYVDVLNKSIFTGWKEKTKARKKKEIDRNRIHNIEKQWESFLSS